MRKVVNIVVALVAIALVTSCNSKKSRNYQYFPNMYESVGYEAYSSHNNEVFGKNNTSEALLPVEGTVSRGWLPYDYKNSTEGYNAAKVGSKNPLAYTKENVENGKALYDIYCAICHGGKGNGKGQLVKTEKILGVPSYDDQGRAITEGSIYHVMYYGLNSMGSYAAQTSIKERWQIVQYVQSLKANLEGKPVKAFEAVVVKNSNTAHSDHGEATSLSLEGESLELHDAHNVEESGAHAVEEVKEKVSHSKKDLLGGKSHHSHKETGKK